MIEPHQAQGLGDLRRHLRLRHLAHLEAEGDVLGHGHVREQRVALEHQAGVALPRRQRGDVALAEPHAAGGRLDEAGDDAQGRGLAAAGGAEQHQELAVGDVERNVVDGLEVAVALGDAGQLQARHRQTTRPILTKRSVSSIARADEQDLQHRHRRDRRVDLPFEILQDRDRQRGAAGTDQEQAHFQVAERGDEAEQGRRDDARQDRRQRDAPERGQAIGAEALRRLLDRAIHADEARRDQPHRPGDRDQRRGRRSGRRASRGSASRSRSRSRHGRHTARCRARCPARSAAAAAGCSPPHARRSARAPGRRAAGTPSARPIAVATTATCRLSRNPETNLSLPGMARNHFSE